MELKVNESTKTKYLPYLWLFVGTVLSVFTHGNHIVSIAVWLALVFLLRFSRSQKIVKGSLFIFIAMIISQTIAHWKMFPVPKVYSLISLMFGLFSAILVLLPVIADRIMHARFNGIISTLIFPTTSVCLYYLNSYRATSGSGFILGFLQYGNLPLQQVTSIFGIYGLAFLILWFASLFNWCWEKDFKWTEIKKPVSVYVVIFPLLLIYGGSRIVIGYPEKNTVRTACITIPRENAVPFDEYTYVMGNKICPPVEKNINMVAGLTAQAADAGAKIIAWQEYSLYLNKKDEKRFIDECCRLARGKKIYLIISYIVFNENELSDNKAVMINPSGIVETDYLKHFPASGDAGEGKFIKKGDGNLPVINTPYGNIALTICFDSYFPYYIHQAGKRGADIMFNLASAWKEITPNYSYGATITAIENGYSLVMCTGSGLSIATDYHGSTLSSMDYFTSNNRIMYADIPVKGVKTIYTYGGYLFGWLCVIGFCVFIVVSIVRVKKK
jgi:apolipoprotein N-acyltransferase